MTDDNVQPIPVSVKEMPATKRERSFKRMTFRTVVLSAGTQFAELLSGPDPARVQVLIVANDAAVVLCPDQATAQLVDNTTTAIPNPRGTLIPQNQVVPIEGGMSEVWVACPLTGNNLNRIGVITVHETDMPI